MLDRGILAEGAVLLIILKSYKVPLAVVSYILEFIAKFFLFILGEGTLAAKR